MKSNVDSRSFRVIKRPEVNDVSLQKVSKSDIESKINSKKAFVELFSLQGGYFLPPMVYLTWQFIRGVLDGSKRLLKIK